jgi:cysteine synthase
MTSRPADILASTGHTPLVELRHVVPDGCARIVVKLESQNPTGSMKDRMALAVVEGAISRGKLAPGGAVIEYTGGSTGTSSGANVVAALRVAARLGPDRRVGTILCDTGLKYLSTDLYAVD